MPYVMLTVRAVVLVVSVPAVRDRKAAIRPGSDSKVAGSAFIQIRHQIGSRVELFRVYGRTQLPELPLARRLVKDLKRI